MKNYQERSKKLSQAQGVELVGLMKVLGRNREAAITELKKMDDAVRAINRSKAAMSPDKRAGFLFEEMIAGTYNASARKAGDFTTTATTGSSGGFGVDPRVDIRVHQSGKIIAEAQAKCCAKPARTAISISKPRYSGTERVVPSGQGKKVQELLTNSAKAKATSMNPRMRQIGRARAEASAKTTEKLTAGGHQSRPVSHDEAIRLAKGDTSKISKIIMVETLSSAAINGAKSGAVFSCGISAITASKKLVCGEISVKDAAKSVAKETIVGGARCAATAVIAEGVKSAAKRSLPKVAGTAILRGAGPMAVAGCVMDVATDAYIGELTIKSAAKSATRAAGGWAGAEGGALLGTAICPGLGTVIGGILGGIGGSLLGGAW